MKKYIILALNISNMGGVHQYCRNKCIAVKKYGYDPIVISGTKGKIYVPELMQYNRYIFPELRYPPYCFTNKTIQKTIRKIIKVLGVVDQESVVECLTVATLEWGEILAGELNLKSVGFIMDEQFDASDRELVFLKFKHSRKELAGIKEESLKILFRNKYHISQDELYYISPLCSNVIDDYDYQIPYKKEEKDIVIGSVGRLDKGYVIPIVQQLKQYFESRPTNNFIMCFVGGSPNNHIPSKIQNILGPVKNVNTFITDYIYPIPRNLIQSFDVSVATSGGANITALYENVPTISVDTHTGDAIGILNYTTTENLYAKTKESLFDLLDNILFGNVMDNLKPLGMTVSPDLFDTVEVPKMMNDFINTGYVKEYYDVGAIKPMGLKYKLYSSIGKVLGADCLTYIHINILNKLKTVCSGAL